MKMRNVRKRKHLNKVLSTHLNKVLSTHPNRVLSQRQNRKLSIGIFLFSVLLTLSSYAQNGVSGTVMDENGNGLEGAGVFWLGTNTGTLTDSLGSFQLSRPAGAQQLAAQVYQYLTDTVQVPAGQRTVDITLRPDPNIDTVRIHARQQSAGFSRLDPRGVQLIKERELLKAACCNLSESFETNPSIDVSFTDAITGSRQIKMLGLAGQYTNFTQENIPGLRGLSTVQGLTFVPGPWMKSLQMSKGTGSVLNGFESIAGQINFELRKPEADEKWYLNAYQDMAGRTDANVLLNRQLSDRLSTGLYLHGMQQRFKVDRNGDDFLDVPRTVHLFALNRWKWFGKGGFVGQAGVQGTYVRQVGGESAYNPDTDRFTRNAFGYENDTDRLNGWLKVGWVNADRPAQSVGLQIAGTYHDQRAVYGLRPYDARERGLYANLIYQDYLGSTRHTFRTGLSWQYDRFDESFAGIGYDRTENVPGAYLEYTWSPTPNFDIVGGLRGDWHNRFGAFATPRLHVRWAPVENTVLRLAAGTGRRTANVFAENPGVFASSRLVVIEGNGDPYAYGLDQERAANLGLTLTQYFTLDYREGSVRLEAFRTEFDNQVVKDLDFDTRQVRFYNLDGRSFANSAQVTLDYEVIRRLDLRLAYRFHDVQTQYKEGLRQQPFNARHRAFVNLAYDTRSKWTFDGTLQWLGPQRIPDTDGSPEEFRLATQSPAFFLLNLQVAKALGKRWEIYAGAENALNFKQDNPILSADDPFGPWFDSSLIWGPILGRRTYAGFRMKIK